MRAMPGKPSADGLLFPSWKHQRSAIRTPARQGSTPRRLYSSLMTGGEPLPPLWRCPTCGRPFANRNQSHACGVGDLDALFARSEPQVRAAFDRVVEVARQCGPLDVVPEKTRVALQVRMSFAAFTPRHRWIDGHFVLARSLFVFLMIRRPPRSTLFPCKDFRREIQL